MSFYTIKWTPKGVSMLDQRVLPNTVKYPNFPTYKAVAKAIKDMVIRGAPAIGCAAAYGYALGATKSKAKTVPALKKELATVKKVLAATRPTAVNLFWALERMQGVTDAYTGDNPNALRKLLVAEAKEVHAEDLAMCKTMGKHGGKLLPRKGNVLTHCNAGALATAGYGTALGVIRGAVAAGKQVTVFADETRPFLQGARLTAWELMEDNIPVTLITDNMAGHFLKSGEISCVVVGSDRIAANGDVANKIGTYGVAVLAHENGIPFYVAAPTSTVDLDCPTGAEIPIEEREATEVTHIGGKAIAPRKVMVRNPAFDVTPKKYVSAIITEQGVARPPFKPTLKKMCTAARKARL